MRNEVNKLFAQSNVLFCECKRRRIEKKTQTQQKYSGWRKKAATGRVATACRFSSSVFDAANVIALTTESETEKWPSGA